MSIFLHGRNRIFQIHRIYVINPTPQQQQNQKNKKTSQPPTYQIKKMQKQMMIKQYKSDHEIYICGICQRQPIKPIVTQCSHIFCWRCIYQFGREKSKCAVCEADIELDKSYPIFVQHEEDGEQEDFNDYAERPAAHQRDKIINPGVGNSTLPPGLTHLQNNLQFRKEVPGSSFVPPMFVNCFNKIAEPKNEEEKDAKIYQLCKKVSYVVGGLLAIAVILVLLI